MRQGKGMVIISHDTKEGGEDEMDISNLVGEGCMEE